MCMPNVLSASLRDKQQVPAFKQGQEVWYNNHRAFIQGVSHMDNGQIRDYVIKQGRRTFTCPASELSSQRPD